MTLHKLLTEHPDFKALEAEVDAANKRRPEFGDRPSVGNFFHRWKGDPAESVERAQQVQLDLMRLSERRQALLRALAPEVQEAVEDRERALLAEASRHVEALAPIVAELNDLVETARELGVGGWDGDVTALDVVRAVEAGSGIVHGAPTRPAVFAGRR